MARGHRIWAPEARRLWRPRQKNCRNRRLLVRTSTGGVTGTPVLTRPVTLDGIEAGSGQARAGSAGGSAERDEAPRTCVDQSPGRRPICARKAHLSLTGGARVTRAKPLLLSTTGLSPAPHKSGSDPDKENAPKPPAKCFVRGVLAWSETPHQQNLRLSCAKTAILYPLPPG